MAYPRFPVSPSRLLSWHKPGRAWDGSMADGRWPMVDDWGMQAHVQRPYRPAYPYLPKGNYPNTSPPVAWVGELINQPLNCRWSPFSTHASRDTRQHTQCGRDAHVRLGGSIAVRGRMPTRTPKH